MQELQVCARAGGSVLNNQSIPRVQAPYPAHSITPLRATRGTVADISYTAMNSLYMFALLSSFDYFKKIEEELVLSEFLKFFEEKNLVIHLNLVNEKIIIFFSLIMILIIGISFYKLPRKKGYVSLMISLGLISSSVMLSILLIDFSALI